jgi:hypothetical protein
MADSNDQPLYRHEPFTRADGREGYLVSDAQTGEALGWHADPPGNVLDRATQRGSQFETMVLLPFTDRALPSPEEMVLPIAEPSSRSHDRLIRTLPESRSFHDRRGCDECARVRGVIHLPQTPPLGRETS